ncbi:MAG: 1,4-alpha-glucan branching protein GlgB [bacterium]
MAGRMKSKTLVYNDISLFTEYDVHLFCEGNHFNIAEKLGAHILTHNEMEGTYFALWAPNASEVSVVGDFNSWKQGMHQLNVRWDSSGIWEGFIPDVGHGTKYKFQIISKNKKYKAAKCDPFARFHEIPPKTASLVWDMSYIWNDDEWMKTRAKRNALDAPISIYEVHLGSWQRVPEDENRFLTYREVAPKLAAYVKEMGFTHVEFLPVMEHPFYGSWGYQITGYFSPTARYGKPQDFMYLMDYLHQQEIGVILDWVPSHFPDDEHGLVYFDGTHLFEHKDPRKGFHPDWNSYIFNYGRNEVKNFLINNALFWFETYHVDGLRVDAVASMLYLNYSRKEGEWVPNQYGGRENLEAIQFMRQLNQVVYEHHPDVQTFAEESTAWPMVSRPTYVGGLGFGFKWNMGWMHDTLAFLQNDPVYRKYHHNQLTFTAWYAFAENFVLPLSHDEVAHGKGSLLQKMPQDDWQKHANLKLLFGFMYAHPGKKLLFMGGEFGQWNEWTHDQSLDWHLLGSPFHQHMQKWVKDLNMFYIRASALYEIDYSQESFEWIDSADSENSVISFVRKGKNPGECVLVVCNFTPIPRHNYRIGVPLKGTWQEVLNSDAKEYGGSSHGNFGSVKTAAIGSHGRYFGLSITVPPLGVVFFIHK